MATHQNDRSFLASVSPNMEALSLLIKLLYRNLHVASILVINPRISNKVWIPKSIDLFFALTMMIGPSDRVMRAHLMRTCHHCLGALLGTISGKTATNGWLGTISGKSWRTALGTISGEWLAWNVSWNNQRGMVVGETPHGLEQSAGKWWRLQRRRHQR